MSFVKSEAMVDRDREHRIFRSTTGTRTTWRWSSLIAIGTVPGTPDEARAFFQRRVALFLKLLWTIFGGLLLFMIGFCFAFLPHPLREVRHPLRVIHFALVLAIFALWIFVRTHPRSMRSLNVLDVAVTIGLGISYAILLSLVPLNQSPVFAFMLVLTYTLSARSAIVPSSPSRTFVIGMLGSIPIAIVTYRTYRATPFVPDYLGTATSATIATIAWCTCTIVLTAAISRVIFGLRRQIARMSQLGQYTLEEKIGEGAMGVVYRASHAMLRRPTAIKLLPPDKAGERTLSRFEREVRMTAKLTHPNTIAIYDYGRTPNGVFYYAMELLDGLDLERLVQSEGAQPASRVVAILRQSAWALAEAHEEGLIHRDIKPANIILCERGGRADFVKVVDFGLVKETSAKASALSSGVQLVIGTPMYMSPESIVTPDTVDGRSDLYALGAVGYYLLTGVAVFEGSTLLEIYAQHLHGAVVPPSERTTRTIPASLEAIILACLEKDPDKRPSDATTLARALEELDDVPRWSQHEAREWWDGRGATMRAARQRVSPVAEGTVVGPALAVLENERS